MNKNHVFVKKNEKKFIFKDFRQRNYAHNLIIFGLNVPYTFINKYCKFKKNT